ncbi:MAG: sensor histidine kinase [Candidatus Puniceispirillum sp.]
MTSAFFAGNSISAKRFTISILVVAALAFLSLAMPTNAMRLGEMSTMMHRLVIANNTTDGNPIALADLPSVKDGLIYKIEVQDTNGTRTHDFKPIDLAVEIYNLEMRKNLKSFASAVHAIVVDQPKLVQLTYNDNGHQLSFIIDQTPMRDKVRGYLPMGFVTLFFGYGVFAVIFYFVLRRLYIAPLKSLTTTLKEFAKDPTVPRPTPNALKINNDFRDAARALDKLQRNTISEMRQRERLADIGEAVAKINHDIRNVLSSATLVADALLGSKDIQVRRTAPHVVRSLEQAVDLCQSMMDYLVAVPDPQLSTFSMDKIANELVDSTKMQITYSGPAKIHADRKMMQRIFLNLARNSGMAGATKLHIDIWRAGHLGIIDISDNGHGIPKQQWDSLFLAFKNHGRGGSGLGLAITKDLVAAQGGHVKLSRSNENGTEFRIQLPVEIFEMSDERDQSSWWPKLNLAS